jgi:hypothetical protein
MTSGIEGKSAVIAGASSGTGMRRPATPPVSARFVTVS